MWGDGHEGPRLTPGVGGPPRCERPLVFPGLNVLLG